MLIAHIHLTGTDLAERRKNAFLERFSSEYDKQAHNELFGKVVSQVGPERHFRYLHRYENKKLFNWNVGGVASGSICSWQKGFAAKPAARTWIGWVGFYHDDDSNTNTKIQEKTNTQVQKVLQI